MSEWSSYLTRGTGPAKKALIGGNWKCNGTTSKIEAMIETLNSSGQFPLESEVVIACPTIHLKECKKFQKSSLRGHVCFPLVFKGFGSKPSLR